MGIPTGFKGTHGIPMGPMGFPLEGECANHFLGTGVGMGMIFLGIERNGNVTVPEKNPDFIVDIFQILSILLFLHSNLD